MTINIASKVEFFFLLMIVIIDHWKFYYNMKNVIYHYWATHGAYMYMYICDIFAGLFPVMSISLHINAAPSFLLLNPSQHNLQ